MIMYNLSGVLCLRRENIEKKIQYKYKNIFIIYYKWITIL